MSEVGWVWHERYAWLDTGRWAGNLRPGGLIEPGIHMENGEAKRRLASLVQASALGSRLTRLEPVNPTDDDILRVHSAAYLRYLRTQDDLPKGGYADPNRQRVPFGRGDLEIAVLSAGGAIAAADAVAEGSVESSYAVVRPSGHHATRDQGLGFCIFANVAIAVEYVRSKFQIERIAVVDWDVHHGNGTQDIFWDDPRTLTISVHQDRLFPVDSGGFAEKGGDAAYGSNVNVPLPPGCGGKTYRRVFNDIVIPTLDAFAPEIVFVACGFDASRFDPNGRMLLGSGDFGWMTEKINSWAVDATDRGAVVVQEGGYSDFYVPLCGIAVLEALTGIDSGVKDPMWERIQAIPEANPSIEFK